MRHIADANLLLPLLTEGHAHRGPAVKWWEDCDDDTVGLCLPVRMALLRLLTNVRVMGSGTLRPEQAWDAVGKLLDDPRITLVDQVPQTHAKHWRANIAKREPTPDLWRMPGLPRSPSRPTAKWSRSTADSACRSKQAQLELGCVAD